MLDKMKIHEIKEMLIKIMAFTVLSSCQAIF